MLANNGNGTDTLNGNPVTIDLVVTYHYTSNGYKWWKQTQLITTGTVVVPKYACRKLYYRIPNL
jgi:hypothetical protein